MKANFFAAVLLLFIIAMPTYSSENLLQRQRLSLSQTNSIKIDLNRVEIMTLSRSFKGIGQKRAEAIVKYRQEHGKFNSIEELAKVKGIGRQFVKNHLSQLQAVFFVD